MEQKADVKAMMARFQTRGPSIDENSSSTPCPKPPLHPTISAIQRKPGFGNSAGNAVTVPPKPSFLKNANRSDSNSHETNSTKTLTSRFANSQVDSNSKPLFVSKPLKSFSQIQESKVFEEKPPINKLPSSSNLFDPKPVFPKPEINSKPRWVKEQPTSPVPPKVPSLPMKPTSSFKRLQEQNEEHPGLNRDTANKSSAQENTPFKPPSNFRNAQNMFNKGTDEDEKTNKLPFTSGPPPKPLASKKPSLKKKDPLVSPNSNGLNGNAALGPKKNPLPNIYALGPAPAKPNRPQKVNLDSFKRSAQSSSDEPGLKKPLPTTPHSNNQSSHVTQSQPPHLLPSLPPRLISPRIQQEDFCDDAEVVTTSPPPLPPSSGHPSQRGKDVNHGNDEDEDEDENEELYVELDEGWEESESKQDKKNDKCEKEEKRRLEAEKKEQKEREKKEQEVKKRFKLVGPMEVIQQGKARTDCKGSKTELSLKQGESLDIIRVQGNPEGKWLGRTSDGTIGYVKTTSVEIDFDTLKNCQNQQPDEQELYDDIGSLSSDNSVMKGSGAFPFSPTGDAGDIYDDCMDANLGLRATPLRQSNTASISDKLSAVSDDEIYDDVDSQSVPRPPPISSLPRTTRKSKTEEMDSKKQKKFEKEEKDFRKKFKYEGEIQVLYEVTIDPTFTNKKWSSKDLPVKAGEKLDVIVKAVDNKLICRNDDGKFGYVSICHIAKDDGDIYDDIGDDCIYDND